MSIPAFTSNNVRIYNVTGYSHHNLPDWVVKRNIKRLKKDAEWSQRVQLLQDFDFPQAGLRLQYTADGRHLIACGVYKPQFRVFDLADLSMKFDRHLTAETVQMTLLGDDWRKLVLLQADRSVEFHGPSGLYHSTRIPRMGRDQAYDPWTCDLVIGATGSEVFRLNLDRGQFLAPLQTAAGSGEGINAVKVAPLHGLYGLGGDGGVVEFWDRRDRQRVASLTLSSSADNASVNVSSLLFHPDGLHWSAGTSDGRVISFDLRSSRPLRVHDHHHGLPIKRIDYHAAARCLVSADARSIKMWQEGSLLAAIEPEPEINDFALHAPSGLIVAAVEAPQMAAYLCPVLGPAPRWCSFLENLTEEMEEKAASQAAVYDNYKFVTREEINRLGLDHLLGTNLLRAYLHGFFIDLRLYEKAKAIANPFQFEQWREQQRQAKLDKERASRIRAIDQQAPIKVNPKLAKRLKLDLEEQQQQEEDDDYEEDRVEVKTDSKAKRKAQKQKEIGKALLADDRFKALFTNPDFEIDETSHDYRLHHPNQ